MFLEVYDGNGEMIVLRSSEKESFLCTNVETSEGIILNCTVYDLILGPDSDKNRKNVSNADADFMHHLCTEDICSWS